MFYQHDIDPIAISLGPLDIRWYGLMYLLSFLLCLAYGNWRIKRYVFIPWTPEQISNFMTWGILGVIFGGRIGYVLFYGFDNFVNNPLYLFRIWEGGMSFHGGMLGVTVAMILYERKHGKKLGQLSDYISTLVPIGLFFGRLGNFIGGELWGKPTDVPWAVIFPNQDLQPRHPSQLYEMFLEGLVLFVVLYFYASKPRPRLSVTGLFLAGYGASRMLVELVRQPDDHIGYLAFNIVTMGQILSLPMVVIGIGMMVYAYRLQEPLFIQRVQEPTKNAATKKHKNRKKIQQKNRNR